MAKKTSPPDSPALGSENIEKFVLNHIPVAVELTEGTERYADVVYNYQPDEIQRIEKTDNQGFLFSCKNGITLRVLVLTEDIFRFTYSLDGDFPDDFSYAIDSKFQHKKVDIDFQESDQSYAIISPRLRCVIDKKTMKVEMLDPSGKIICKDSLGFSAQKTILRGISKVAIHKTAPLSESYFGLGDKTRPANLRGHLLHNWCTDAFGFHEKTDETYRAIPFYFGLNDGAGYGIFLDNSYRSEFDFDSHKTGELSFSAEGGQMNYYFLNGPRLLSVAERYTDLTGKPELPPIWALGFHQCRWSYFPEDRVREVALEFRKRSIPCDSIYLDIDYMDGYRCFTWNKEYFPKPKLLIDDLKNQGFHTVVMIDPGIKVDPEYSVYQEGKKEDVFCKRPDGETMVGPVWPPECVFPDFTNPAVRDWWGPLYRELYDSQNVSGFWNDMNEPAVFKVKSLTFPNDIRHDHDGHPCSHAKAHNIYGLNMSRATQEGLKKLKPQKRPFVLTRATFSGGQRYAAAWTGDNVASWSHLKLANLQCQRMSISGFSFIGSDIGGFVDQPSGELMLRWLQLGIFHPLYRVHSMGNNVDGAAEVDAEGVKKSIEALRLDQEPWVFGEQFEKLNKQAIELRYQLLPMIYTAFWQYATTGSPMIKPLIFVDQEDERCMDQEQEFLFGDHLLVSPVVELKAIQQTIYLPKGQWYSFQGSESYAGKQFLKIPVKLSTIPIFVRSDAVISRYPVMQYTGQKAVAVLNLDIYYVFGEVESQLYEDAGDGYSYLEGDFAHRTFRVKGNMDTLEVEIERSGNAEDSYSHYSVQVFGLPFKPQKAQSDNSHLPIEKNQKSKAPVYQLKVEATALKITLSR